MLFQWFTLGKVLQKYNTKKYQKVVDAIRGRVIMHYKVWKWS
jgi:hypothetical protein